MTALWQQKRSDLTNPDCFFYRGSHSSFCPRSQKRMEHRHHTSRSIVFPGQWGMRLDPRISGSRRLLPILPCFASHPLLARTRLPFDRPRVCAVVRGLVRLADGSTRWRDGSSTSSAELQAHPERATIDPKKELHMKQT